MSRVTTPMRALAKRLLAYEIGINEASAASPTISYVYVALRPQLTTLMGEGGRRALLLRALRLATPEVPWLRDVQPDTDGSMRGLEALESKLDPDVYLEGRVILLTQIIRLLVAFIGEQLTMHLVSETFPKAALKFFDLRDGDTE